MVAQQISHLQLGWTDGGIVAWTWPPPTGRVPGGGSLYSTMTREWGWMPPGSWSTVVSLHSPRGIERTNAIVLPPTAVLEPPAPRRGVEQSASTRWVQAVAELARRTVADGLVRPATVVTAESSAPEARWVPVRTPQLETALAALAELAPPIVFAVRSADDDLGGDGDVSRGDAGVSEGQRDGDGRDGQPIDRTRGLHAWLCDLAARHGLYSRRWAAPLSTARGPDASISRACFQALARPDARIAAPRLGSAIERLPALEAGTALLLASADGVPVLRAHLRLGLPADPADADCPWPLDLELVDRNDTSRWCQAEDVWRRGPLASELAGPNGRFDVLEDALRVTSARLLATPTFRRHLDAWHGAAEPGALDIELGATLALLEHVEFLESLGVELHAPDQLLPRRPSVRGESRPATAGSGKLGREVLVDWRIEVDGKPVDPSVLERAATTGATLLHADGRWVRIDATAARRALGALAEHDRDHRLLDVAGVLRLAAAIEAEDAAERALPGSPDGAGALPPPAVRAEGWLADLLDGLPDDRLDEAGEPPGFLTPLRHYQRRGLGWLQLLARLGLGGCLADDMGLGKTPTALAHLVGRPGPHLVLCPLSVVRNWQSEAARFAPDLRVVVHHGGDRLRGDALVRVIETGELPEAPPSLFETDQELAIAVAAGPVVVVTTYGLAVRDTEELASVRWSTVVLDEAQAIKNAHTHAARTVRRLPADQKIALTGTPVENRLGELWAILDAVNPGLLGSEQAFATRWAQPIERDGDLAKAAGLRRLTGPFVLRRTKADRSLVPDLPDKVEQIAWATLTAEQATMYRSVVEQLLAAADGTSGMQRRGLVLGALTRLKQICNHPAHATGDGSRLAGRSGKLARFDELVTDFVDAGERALVFTQYRQMGELLQRHLTDQHALTAPFLHGGVPKARRDRMVEEFQAGRGAPLLLVSLKAGGTGLNLTAASRVVHYDRWWNPAVEDQATDRAWRLGQRQAVFVHKLVCQGTVEERIAEIIDDKRRLAGLVVGPAGSGETWLSELSTDDLRDLVVLGADAVVG